MTNEDIFDYTLRQFTKVLRSKKINFNDAEIKKISKDFNELANKIFKMYIVNNQMPIGQLTIDEEQTNQFFKNMILGYATPNLFRGVFQMSLTQHPLGYQIYKSENIEVDYNSSDKSLIVNGGLIALSTLNGNQIRNEIYNIIKLINDDVLSGAKLLSNHKPKIIEGSISNEIKKVLSSKKFSSLNKPTNIDRLLIQCDNIVHTQIQEKLVSNNLLGLPSPQGKNGWFKEWTTQRDSRVRVSHNDLDKVDVPIQDKFRVGGYLADKPRDNSLPDKEKINCRCYLNYIKYENDEVVDFGA